MTLNEEQQTMMEDFYLTDAGYLHGSSTKCSILMDSTPRYNIVHLFKMNFGEKGRISSYSAVDEFGMEKFSAIDSPSTHDDIANFSITAASLQIGRFKIQTVKGNLCAKLQIYEKPERISIHGKLHKEGVVLVCKFQDTRRINVCLMLNKAGGVFHIQVNRELKEKAKSVLFCVAILLSHKILKHCYNLPRLSISNLQKEQENVSCAHQTQNATAFEQLFSLSTILIRPVGHNSLKNKVYYDIYDKPTHTTHATIEVTPMKDYQGYAQMVVKDCVGETVCTAVHFSQQMVTAIYNDKKSLIGYRKDQTIYNARNQPIVNMAETNPSSEEGSYLRHKVQSWFLHPSSKYTLATEIFSASGAQNINSSCNWFRLFFNLVGVILLSMNRHLERESSKRPTPEIEYYYVNSKPSTRSFM